MTTYDAEAARADWHSVFVSSEPFGDPFAPGVEAIALAYPTDGFVLSEVQFHALAGAIGRRRDRVHLVTLESPGDFLATGGIYSGTLPPYQEYVALVRLPLETALFSADWGVITSHEDHALIGGEAVVIEAFKREYGTWKTDLDAFLTFWASNRNGDFVRALLRRLAS